MEYALFVDTRLRNTIFDRCEMSNTAFDRADIAGSLFMACNLEGASFAGSHLERADFSEAYNYTLRPEECFLKKTVFSEEGLRGLVSHWDILIR